MLEAHGHFTVLLLKIYMHNTQFNQDNVMNNTCGKNPYRRYIYLLQSTSTILLPPPSTHTLPPTSCFVHSGLVPDQMSHFSLCLNLTMKPGVSPLVGRRKSFRSTWLVQAAVMHVAPSTRAECGRLCPTLTVDLNLECLGQSKREILSSQRQLT